jgi:hypothetical protein
MNRLKSTWSVTAEEHAALVPATVKQPERWLVHRCYEESAAHGGDDAALCPSREKPRNRCLSVIDMSDVMHLFW